MSLTLLYSFLWPTRLYIYIYLFYLHTIPFFSLALSRSLSLSLSFWTFKHILRFILFFLSTNFSYSLDNTEREQNRVAVSDRWQIHCVNEMCLLTLPFGLCLNFNWLYSKIPTLRRKSSYGRRTRTRECSYSFAAMATKRDSFDIAKNIFIFWFR